MVPWFVPGSTHAAAHADCDMPVVSSLLHFDPHDALTGVSVQPAGHPAACAVLGKQQSSNDKKTANVDLPTALVEEVHAPTRRPAAWRVIRTCRAIAKDF
eukprot:1365439-Pleurochrysis_carterae.AAC.1